MVIKSQSGNCSGAKEALELFPRRYILAQYEPIIPRLEAVKRGYVKAKPLLPKNSSRMQHLRKGEHLASEMIVAANK